jgi:hypothetical protein
MAKDGPMKSVVLPFYSYDNEVKIWQLDEQRKPDELLYIGIGHND